MLALVVAGADRLDPARRHAERVVHDREVVRGEVPQHVEVGLEQAEVDPDRVEVEDAAELSTRDEVTNLADRARAHERVIDH